MSGVPATVWLTLTVLTLGCTAFAVTLLLSEPLVQGAKSTWLRYARWAEHQLHEHHMTMRVPEFCVRHLLTIVAALALGLYVTTVAKSLILMALGALAPIVWFKRAAAKRQQALNEQLESGLQTMANAVLATQNLVDGFDALAKHGTPPLSLEADLLLKELRVGTTVDEAMNNFAARCHNRNTDAVITALAIGRRTGGNLPKVLELISRVIRETLRIEGLIASKTSEGKASGWLMAALPGVFLIAMSTLDPEWTEPLYNDVIGNFILAAVVLLNLGGALLIRKVSTIDV